MKPNKENKPKRVLTVDASGDNITKIFNYRGVWSDTGEIVFNIRCLTNCTNNIAEFLAVVHGLAYCKKKGITTPVYTDSTTAMAWVRDAKIKTCIIDRSGETFSIVDRAINWLKNNSDHPKVHKWITHAWGEVPADYGLKNR